MDPPLAPTTVPTCSRIDMVWPCSMVGPRILRYAGDRLAIVSWRLVVGSWGGGGGIVKWEDGITLRRREKLRVE